MTTPAIPTSEPASLVAGETWKWLRDLGDYPAGTWTLKYEFRPRTGGTGFAITASQYGTTTQHLVSVAYATTAGYTAGNWVWQAYVTSGTDRFHVDSGEMTISPDLAASSADTRSHVAKTYDALKDVVEGKATRDTLSTSINGKTLQRMSWDEILQAYQHFKRLALNEAIAAANSDDPAAASSARTIRHTMGNA